MADDPKAVQDLTRILAEVRAQVMGEPEGEASLPAPIPGSQVEAMHLEELLRQINQEWDLTRYSLDSKRKNYAQLVTGFKKMLDLVMKPYANIFLYQQATYNSHVVQILNLLGQKLGRMEQFLSEISHEQSAVRALFESKIDETNRKLDHLTHDVHAKHAQTQQILIDGFAQSHQNLDDQRMRLEQAKGELSQEMEARHGQTQQALIDGFEASQQSLREQKDLVSQLHHQIMDDLADGLRSSLTEVAQRLQTISTMVDKHRQDLERKLDHNIDTLLDILTEETSGKITSGQGEDQ